MRDASGLLPHTRTSMYQAGGQVVVNPTILVMDLLNFSSGAGEDGLDARDVASVTVLGAETLLAKPHSNTCFALTLLHRVKPNLHTAVITSKPERVGSKIKRIAKEAGVKKGGGIWIGPRWRKEVKEWLGDDGNGMVYDEDILITRHDSRGGKKLEESIEVLVGICWDEVLRAFKTIGDDEIKREMMKDGRVWKAMEEGTWREEVFSRIVNDVVNDLMTKVKREFGGIKKLRDLVVATGVWKMFDAMGTVEFCIWLEMELEGTEVDWRGANLATEIVNMARGRIYQVDEGEVRRRRGGDQKIAALGNEVLRDIRENYARRKAKKERFRKKNRDKIWWDEFGGVDVVVVCNDQNYDAVRDRVEGKEGGDKVWLRYIELRNRGSKGRKLTTLSESEQMWGREEGRVRGRVWDDGNDIIPRNLKLGVITDTVHGGARLATSPEDVGTPSIVVLKRGAMGGGLLKELKEKTPQHVVLFDCTLEDVRAVEVYGRMMDNMMKDGGVKHIMTRVYSLSRAPRVGGRDPVQLEIGEEEAAFDKIIEFKRDGTVGGGGRVSQEMELAIEQGGGVGGTFETSNGDLMPLAYGSGNSTRRGRGDIIDRVVAVDIREFKCGLPSALYERGMRIVPITMAVGDYVVAKELCIERKQHAKGRSDLRGSLANGRLMSQCEGMEMYYPDGMILLIEREEGVGAVTSYEDMHGDGRQSGMSIITKIAVLLMKFQKLRIAWSRGHEHSGEIIESMKRGRQAVDLEKAKEAGSNDDLDKNLLHNTVGKEGEGKEPNVAARKILLRLPGITPGNAKAVMREVPNLRALAGLEKSDMKRVLGSVQGAEKLWNFFNKKIVVEEVGSNKKGGKGGKGGKKQRR